MSARRQAGDSGGLSMNTEFISSWTSFCAVQSSPLLPWLELIGSTGMMTLHSTATQHYYWRQMQEGEGKIRTKGWMIRLNFSEDFRCEGMTLNRLDGIIADAEPLGFDTSFVCNESKTFLICTYEIKSLFFLSFSAYFLNRTAHFLFVTRCKWECKRLFCNV